MKVTRRNNTAPNIDMSPMLDVIFQLILFFLVSTTFAMLPGISLNLPASTTAQGTDSSGITITVEENGAMYFNDQSCTLDTLPSFLNSLDTGTMSREVYPVMVCADENVTNGTIVKIFDALRISGFSAVSLRTASEK